MQATNYTEYHPSTGWNGHSQSQSGSLSPGSSWSLGHENGHKLEGSPSNQRSLQHQNFNQQQRQQSSIYASPIQVQRPVYYPMSANGFTPTQPPQKDQLRHASPSYYPTQNMASPQAVYDEPSFSSSKESYGGDSDGLFSPSKPYYPSWKDQQDSFQYSQSTSSPTSHHDRKNQQQHQSNTSLSMGSPAPQRSIWGVPTGGAVNNEDSLPKSRSIGPSGVYRATDEEDQDLGMTRLSLLSAPSNSILYNQKQLHSTTKEEGASVQSGYSNQIPGLVQACSESTTSLPTIASPYLNQKDTATTIKDANTILSSSLRSFLGEDDIGGVQDPSLGQSQHPQPPGFQHPNAQRLPGVPGHGNASTRKNRQRNKVRMQKKRQEAKDHPQEQHGSALKELNQSLPEVVSPTTVKSAITTRTSQSSLYPKIYDNQQQGGTRQSPSSKKKVGQQQSSRKNENSSSETLRMLTAPPNLGGRRTDNCEYNVHSPALNRSVLDLDGSFQHAASNSLRLTSPGPKSPQSAGGILPQQWPIPPSQLDMPFHYSETNFSEDEDDTILQEILANEQQQQQQQRDSETDDGPEDHASSDKKREWLLRMNKKLQDISVGELDPSAVPISAIMNAFAKTKSAEGASMVEMWLKRAQQEFEAGNHRIAPTTKMYTMAGMQMLCVCYSIFPILL